MTKIKIVSCDRNHRVKEVIYTMMFNESYKTENKITSNVIDIFSTTAGEKQLNENEYEIPYHAREKNKIETIIRVFSYDNVKTLRNKIALVAGVHPAEISFITYPNDVTEMFRAVGRVDNIEVEILSDFLRYNNLIGDAQQQPGKVYTDYIAGKWSHFNPIIFATYIGLVSNEVSADLIIENLDRNYVTKFNRKLLTRLFESELTFIIDTGTHEKIFSLTNISVLEGKFYVKLEGKDNSQIFSDPNVFTNYVKIMRHVYQRIQKIRTFQDDTQPRVIMKPNSVIIEVGGSNELISKKGFIIEIDGNGDTEIDVKWPESDPGRIDTCHRGVHKSLQKAIPPLFDEKTLLIPISYMVRIRIYGLAAGDFEDVSEEVSGKMSLMGYDTNEYGGNTNYVMPDIITDKPDIPDVPPLMRILTDQNTQEQMMKMNPRFNMSFDSYGVLTINLYNIRSQYEISRFTMIMYGILSKYPSVTGDPSKIIKISKFNGGNSKILANNDPKAFGKHRGYVYARYCQCKRMPTLLYPDEVKNYPPERVIQMINQTYGRLDYYLLPEKYPIPGLVKNDIFNNDGEPICTLCGSKKLPDSKSHKMIEYKDCIATMGLTGKIINRLPAESVVIKKLQKLSFGIQELQSGREMNTPKNLSKMFGTSWVIKEFNPNGFKGADTIIDISKTSPETCIELIMENKMILENGEPHVGVNFIYKDDGDISIEKPEIYTDISEYASKIKDTTEIYYFIEFPSIFKKYWIHTNDKNSKVSTKKNLLTTLNELKIFKSEVRTVFYLVKQLADKDIRFIDYYPYEGWIIGAVIAMKINGKMLNIYLPINKYKMTTTIKETDDVHIGTRDIYRKLIKNLGYIEQRDVTSEYDPKEGYLIVTDSYGERLMIPYCEKPSIEKFKELSQFQNMYVDFKEDHNEVDDLIDKVRSHKLFKEFIDTPFGPDRFDILKKILRDDGDALLVFYQVKSDAKKYFANLRAYRNSNVFKKLKGEHIITAEMY